MLLALVVVAAGTWVAATRLVSPDQVAAQAEPPDPVPVVAALTRGYLHAPVSLSATAAQEQVVTVTPPAAVTGVVTAAGGTAGQQLTSGEVLLRLSGRPLFVLSGSFALYRDIQPGDSGDDVAALQSGLVEAGYSVRIDGVYGPGTQAAVRRMYRDAGYAAPQATTAAAATTTSQSATATTGDETTSTPAPEASAAATSAGTPVLRSEVLMVGGLPATLRSVAEIGTQLAAESTLMTLGSGTTVLSATVPTTSLGSLAVGAVAQFTDDTGTTAAATVTAITADAQDDQSTIVVTPQVQVSIGTTYVLTVTNPAAEPTESLLAPVTGVVTRGGRSYVYVQDGETFDEVEVTVSAAVGGVAAITPIDPDIVLDAGQEIRVG